MLNTVELLHIFVRILWRTEKNSMSYVTFKLFTATFDLFHASLQMLKKEAIGEHGPEALLWLI